MNRRTKTSSNARPKQNPQKSGSRSNGAKKSSSSGARKAKVQKKMNISSVFIVALFMVFVSIYLGRTVYSMMTRTDIPSMTVTMGTVDLPQEFEGIIIRNERVYTSTVAGVVNFNFNDLERVRKDDVVCAVWDQREYNLWLDELSKINADMLNLQERRGSMSAYEQDVIAFNERIREYINDKLYVSLSEGIVNVYDVRESIIQNMNIRNQISLSENRGSVQNYYDQRVIFESGLNANTDRQRAIASGILSYTVDGLEDELTFQSMTELSAGQIHATGNGKRNSNENLAKPGDALFRIVESNEWYVAVRLNIEQVYDWTEGMLKTIYIQYNNGYRELETTIHKISRSESEAFVLFKSTKYLLDFINIRNVRLKTSNSVHTGYKIPNSAIVNKTFLKIPSSYLIKASDQNTYFMLRRSIDRDIMTQVRVYTVGDDFCLITPDVNALSLGDKVVQGDADEEYTITEVENCKGVYVINNGYANFRRITLNEAIPEKNPYTILNPNENKSVKIFDRIISDARNIIDGQKVY